MSSTISPKELINCTFVFVPLTYSCGIIQVSLIPSPLGLTKLGMFVTLGNGLGSIEELTTKEYSFDATQPVV